jgi:carbonic anhydrase
LPSKYRLEQIHAHWGCSENEGSEHTVDGQSYPGEIHLVHWDCEKYASFGEAAGAEGGLTVLGVFMTVGDSTHEEIQKVVDALPSIPHKGMTEALPVNVNPAKLLPEGDKFWNYEGSLTTPPCNETVNWIVFKDPITVSKEQIEAFRSMKAYSPEEDQPGEDEFGGQIIKNFRPPMPLCGRLVRDCC